LRFNDTLSQQKMIDITLLLSPDLGLALWEYQWRNYVTLSFTGALA